MQDSELIALWRSYDQKLEENLMLNRRNAEAITLIKVKSLVGSMVPMKLFIIIASTLWVAFLSVVLVHTYSYASSFFWYSLAIHVVLLTIVILIYGYQIGLIFQTDLSEPLIKTQHRLASLRSSTLLISRLMFLHAPVWATFSIQEQMLNHPTWLMVQGLITLAFIVVALWLFFNIKYENRDKKWFRFLFKGKEWEPVIKSLALLEELGSYSSAK
ncbi:hypothetical protein M0L20_25485 [Spirosoma sp. RP8]|uniref:Uncharacterized protein n=1 Tax=Spirosoma liriopis TaxID=2937440 RepID=A0ABT0HUE3_9BACT|nr:hypothetical protein [Spirosoma liriopis]MCK8495248.1 hypothetical protein [Spirosoma liriopis]